MLNDEQIKQNIEKLSKLEYKVTQEDGTEPAFTGVYDDCFEKGIYVDIVTKIPLFASSDKFDSGCGWPAFSKPIDQSTITYTTDNSYGTTRTKVDAKNANTHLGHVFEDGPKESGGLRFCINSASLEFIKFEDMEKLGYAEFKDLVK